MESINKPSAPEQLLMRTAKLLPLLHHAIFISIWAFTLHTGMIGIDFGRHWDERKLFASIRDSIPNAEILPGWYNYPSMIYDITAISSSPEIISTYIWNKGEFSDRLEIWLADREFVIRTRGIFLFLSTLSMLWTYLLIFKLTRQWSQAVLGAALLASSWEFAYHARWIAPDAILMQFGILCILLIIIALDASGKSRYVWLGMAAVAAGLACGTKYYGGMYLLPVFMGAHKLYKDKNAKAGEYVLLYSLMVLIFIFAFLITTPGALLDSARFIQDIQFEISHYKGGHPGYTVNPGGQHASLLFTYLFGVFFSKYQWISILFSAFTLAGLYSMIRDGLKKYETWIFLSIPLFYIPYISLQSVMMVRNYLLLFPILAILSARGMAIIWESKLIRSSNIFGYLAISGLILTLAINFKWVYVAARSIRARESIDQTQELRDYLNTNNDTIFYLSDSAKRLLFADNNGRLENLTENPSLTKVYVYLSHEVENPVANRPGIYNPIFGPYEVNFDYYPSWDGDSRVIIMPMESALQQSQFIIPGK